MYILEKQQLLIWSLIKFYNSAFYAYNHLIFLSSHIPRPEEEEEEGGFCSFFGRLHSLMIILLLLSSFLVVLSQQFSARGTIKLVHKMYYSFAGQTRLSARERLDHETTKYIFKSRFNMD